MYGKVFECMFTGSMVGAGSDIYAIWTYCIVKAVRGVVEINPKLLSTTIGTPIENVERAIEFLCQPDPYSRSQVEEGRRLVREGQFSYRVVNHAYYRGLISMEDKREADRVRMQERRAKERENPNKIVGLRSMPERSLFTDEVVGTNKNCDCREESQIVADVAQAEANTESKTDTTTKPKNNGSAQKPRAHPVALEIWFDTYRSEKGADYYPSNFGEDTKHATWILEICKGDQEVLRRVYELFLRDKDKILEKSGWALRHLRQNVNGYLQRAQAPPEAERRLFDTPRHRAYVVSQQ